MKKLMVKIRNVIENNDGKSLDSSDDRESLARSLYNELWDIISIFKVGEVVLFEGEEVTVLLSRCSCKFCGNKLQEPVYSIKLGNGHVYHNIPESKLEFTNPV